MVSYSQEKKPLRVEIEAKSYSDEYYIVPAGKLGLILFFKDYEFSGKNDQWVVTGYDVDFKEIWSKNNLFERGFSYLDYKVENQMLFLLFEKTTTSGQKINIVTIDILTGKLENTFFDLEHKINIGYFVVIGNSAIVSGEVFQPKLIRFHSSIKPITFWFDLSSKLSKYIIPEVKTNTYVINCKKFSEVSVAVVYKSFDRKKGNKLLLQIIDESGEILQTKEIVNKTQFDLVSCEILSKNLPKSVHIGTYNVLQSREFIKYSLDASGFYFSSYNFDSLQAVKFYSFSNLKNLSKIFRKSGLTQIKSANKKQIIDGVLLHDVETYDGKYYLISEFFYPQYTYITYYDPASRMTRTQSQFEGYRYTGALLVCFNEFGELIWDNIIEVNNILSKELRERVKLFVDGVDVIMVYSEDGKLHYQVFNNGVSVDKKQSSDIETYRKGDQLRGDYFSDIEYWYDHYFVAYGYQKIKSQSTKKREVFYFNKIAFK